MPTHTLPISQTVLPGQPFTGSLNVGNNTHADIATDRTAPGGLNSLGADSTVDCQFSWSADAGANWLPHSGALWAGGIYHSGRSGAQLDTDRLTITDLNPAANRFRVIITVAGPSPVTLTGTATVS